MDYRQYARELQVRVGFAPAAPSMSAGQWLLVALISAVVGALAAAGVVLLMLGQMPPPKKVTPPSVREQPAPRSSSSSSSDGSASAVQDALRWLRDHQQSDGSWNPAKFAEAGAMRGRTGSYANRDGTADTGSESAQTGITGLALLAFLGAGHTHKDGEFKTAVKSGLDYLVSIQSAEGLFASPNQNEMSFFYGHAICSMAMIEAYAMSGDAALKGPAQKAVDFIGKAQNVDPDSGPLGWRYGVRPGDNDTSVTGWMVMALKSAKIAELDVPAAGFKGAKAWFDRVTANVNGYPKTGYITPGGSNARLAQSLRFEPNDTMNAIHILCTLLMANQAEARNNSVLKAQAAQMLAESALPTATDANKIDYYYWYMASLAQFQMGDKYWKGWAPAMRQAVLQCARHDGGAKDACYGSFDAVDAWSPVGGRVYATAINCLTLEVYYRYQRASEK